MVPVGLAFKSVCYYISSFCFSVSFQKRGLRLLFFINSSPSSLHFGGAREFRSSREREKDRKELKKTKIMKIRLLPYHQTTFPAWFFQIWSPYLWDLTRCEIGKCKKLQKLTYLISCAHRLKKNRLPGYTPELSGHGHKFLGYFGLGHGLGQDQKFEFGNRFVRMENLKVKLWAAKLWYRLISWVIF